MGYMGAFVPVVYTSPCPGFNRGKTVPGGGCENPSTINLSDVVKDKALFVYLAR